MRTRSLAILVALLLAVPCSFARGKSKAILPAYVLTAKTVSVVIDPDSGIDPEDPRANQTARKDVETALLNWGRFEPMVAGQPADLVIVLRRGQRRPVSETIPDARQNDRMGAINPTDNGVQIGAHQGQSPQNPGMGPTPGPAGQSPTTQTEIGSMDDSFTVYDGALAHPLETPPGWRYVGHHALQPHLVPAVAQFRKAVAEAEKALVKQP
jgi:hypothetical protein